MWGSVFSANSIYEVLDRTPLIEKVRIGYDCASSYADRIEDDSETVSRMEKAVVEAI